MITEEQEKLRIWITGTALCAGVTFTDLITAINNPNATNIITTALCTAPLAYCGYRTYQLSKKLLQKQR